MAVIKMSLDGSDVEVVAALRLTNTRLIEAATTKMTFLMNKVEEKLRSGGPRTIPDILATNLKNQGAENEGGNIIGTMSWAGRTDQYAINPLTQAGTRKHRKGEVRRRGQDVLHFFWQKAGKEVYLKYIFHPPFPGTDIISEAFLAMKGEFIQGLTEAISGAARTMKRF